MADAKNTTPDTAAETPAEVAAPEIVTPDAPPAAIVETAPPAPVVNEPEPAADAVVSPPVPAHIPVYNQLTGEFK